MFNSIISSKNSPGLETGAFIVMTAIVIMAISFIVPVSAKTASEPKRIIITEQDSLQELVTGREFRQMMDEMHDKMKKTEKTGNPDLDFASMMIEHHKGSVSMSEYVMDNGQNSWVLSTAERIKDDQEDDIERLQDFLYHGDAAMHEGDDSDTDDEQLKMEDNENLTGSSSRNMEIMEDMTRQMNAMNLSGNPDKDYISMMIIHHRSAVRMAEEYLEEGKNEQLREMAEKMIMKNEEEIQELERWREEKK